MKQLKMLLQRLLSADWKTAIFEVGILGVSVTAMVAAFKSKNYADLFSMIQGKEFLASLGSLSLFARLLISSNNKAIANDMLPQITGQ